MIEQDPIHSKEVIGFPEVDHYPVCIELSSTCGKKREIKTRERQVTAITLLKKCYQ